MLFHMYGYVSKIVVSVLLYSICTLMRDALNITEWMDRIDGGFTEREGEVCEDAVG